MPANAKIPTSVAKQTRQGLPEKKLSALRKLPRPLYGQAETLPNQTLRYRHSHRWGQLAYAAEGVIEVHTDGGRFVAPPQRAIWIPAGIVHRVSCGPATCVRSLYIQPDIADWARDRCRVIVVSPLLREMIRHFSQLPVEYDELGPDGRFASVLLETIGQADEVELMLPLPRSPLLQKLCRSLREHPEEKHLLAEWADQASVSEKTLSRLFVRETGLSFRHWRQRMRLLGALPALERGDSVTDVALACGYDSLSAFIAAFKKQFNCTPGNFLQPG